MSEILESQSISTHDAAVIVHLNNSPIRLPNSRPSGILVKREAIQQGVRIKLDFALFEEIGHDQARYISDDEIVHVTPATRFLADVEVIAIHVNRDPVSVDGRHQTGKSIKAAAIEQHVRIKPDFILLELLPGDRTKQIKDDQPVLVDDCSRFDAIPDDDHS